ARAQGAQARLRLLQPGEELLRQREEAAALIRLAVLAQQLERLDHVPDAQVQIDFGIGPGSEQRIEPGRRRREARLEGAHVLEVAREIGLVDAEARRVAAIGLLDRELPGDG